MKRRIIKKLGMNERKYALCLMIAGFAALNTGFTSQNDVIQSADVAQVVEVEQVPSETAQVEEKTKIENDVQEEVAEVVEEAEEISTVEEPAVENVIEISGNDFAYSNVMSMEASAYLPADGGGSGITATGIPATYGVVAVDPGVIPLGTRLYIPGYGEAVAADTGGAIRGYKIDLCMESYSQAMQFGRRNVTVYVLE